MALAFAEVPETQDVYGKTRRKVFDVTLETSYAAGGTTITPANIGLRTITGGRIIGGNATAKSLLYFLDTTTTPGSAKLICMFPGGGSGTSPTTLANQAVAAGAVAMTSTAANGAADLTPGVGVEVGATADLHAGVVRIEFFGN